MIKLSKSIASLALLGAMGAQADVIGGSVEATYWQAGYSGQVTEGANTVDLENDLNFDDSGVVEIAATLEHPVPVLPNIRIKHISLDETANGTLSTTFDGITFSGPVETNLDLSHYDLIMYYEILDNYVSVDLGLDIKVFDGQLDISNATESSNTEIDEVVPLPYVSAEIALPLTDLSFGAEVSGVKYSDSSMYDAKARLRQGFSLAFIEIGYRQMAIDIEDVSDIDVDLDLSGAYISTGLDF